MNTKIIVIDDSLSMKDHKEEIIEIGGLLGYCLKGFDDDGVDMHLAVARKAFRSGHSKKLKRAISDCKFKAPCNMANFLEPIFEDYKEKIQSHTQIKPTVLYILTNAVWLEVCEVEAQIVNFVRFLEKHNVALHQVGIQFIRFGDSAKGEQRLQALDKLKARKLVDR